MSVNSMAHNAWKHAIKFIKPHYIKISAVPAHLNFYPETIDVPRQYKT